MIQFKSFFRLVLFIGILVAWFQAESAAQSNSSVPAAPVWNEQKALSPARIKRTIEKLRPLAEKLPAPQPGEWLANHDEQGQTFSQYARSRPVVLTSERHKLYVQPIGQFSATQQRLIKLTANYLEIYFNCPVPILETQPGTIVPNEAQRIHPETGQTQWLTSHLLDNVLVPNLPDDAFAVIAFTTTDLWPGEGWNFVFGYASLRNRVGVWSLARLGDPDESPEAFQRCLIRTLKIASHETGHMFSMAHCRAYSCNMQGSNSLSESDRQPLALCPECHAKILMATAADPVERYGKLIEFCESHELREPLPFFRAAQQALMPKRSSNADDND